MLMFNSILRACIQQAVHAGSLYVNTTISVTRTIMDHLLISTSTKYKIFITPLTITVAFT